MDPNLICPAILFLFIILLIQAPLTLCEYNTSSVYEACAESFSCGDIDGIGYPFWGGSQPEYCGHPSFGLSCNDESHPELSILSVKYRVLDISSQAATIVRDDLLSNICPSNPQRTSLDLNLFSYTPSGNQNITLFYGCTITNPVSIPIPYLINCTEDISDSNKNVLWSPGTGLPTIPGISSSIFRCGSDIFVTVTQENFDALVKASLVTEELLRTYVSGGFSVNWKANNSLCDNCTESGGRCGSNGDPISTQFICFIDNSSSNKTPLLAIGLGIAGAVMAGVGIGWLIFRHKRKRVVAANEQVLPVQNIEALVRTNGFHSTKLYTYSDIKKMTNSFSDKIGQGGFGSVYRGKLPNGYPVAVKLLSNTKGNGEDFINEVASISRTSHVNIVTLVGFCYKKKRALVYEFMPNGSLDKYIGNMESPNKNCHLEWKTLYQIAIGIARGLEYLHRGCNTRIMHFDIKPNNILLDKDFTPKISDFGLAKLCKKKESVVSLSVYGARGTIGYIAPEVFFRSIGSVSHKSDVYSYGMTVIDMVGVREKASKTDQTSDSYFPNWIYEHLEQGLDLSVEGIRDEEDKEMAMKMILVSLWCIQTNPADRPSITKVVEMLEGSTATLQIPPKPFFSPPSDDSPQQSPTSSSVTTEI